MKKILKYIEVALKFIYLVLLIVVLFGLFVFYDYAKTFFQILLKDLLK